MRFSHTLCRLISFVLVIYLCSFCAVPVNAQHKEDSCRVTINVTLQPVSKILWMISKQTGFMPTYGEAAGKLSTPLTVNYKNEKLSVVLNDLLGKVGCTFHIKSNTIYIL